MQKSISLGTRWNPQVVAQPAIVALVVVGAAGAYALQYEPGKSGPLPEAATPQVAMAVSFAPEARVEAQLASISPARAQQALDQVAALQSASEPFERSFAGAFAPLTEGKAARRSILALARSEPVPEQVAEAAAPIAAPEPVPAAQTPSPATVSADPAAAAAPLPEVAPAPVAMAAPPPAPVAEPAAASVEAVPTVAAAHPAAPMPLPEQASETPAAPPALAFAMVEAIPARVQPAVAAALPPEPEPAAALATPLPVAAPAAVLSAAAPAAVQQDLASPAAPAVVRQSAPTSAPRAAPITAKPKPSAALAKSVPSRSPALRLAGPQIPSRYRLVEGGVETRIGVQMYGERLGAVPLRVLGSGLPTLRLGDLLGLVQSRLTPGQYERLATSAAAEEFVSLDTLRKAGIPVRYDAARDELKLGED